MGVKNLVTNGPPMLLYAENVAMIDNFLESPELTHSRFWSWTVCLVGCPDQFRTQLIFFGNVIFAIIAENDTMTVWFGGGFFCTGNPDFCRPDKCWGILSIFLTPKARKFRQLLYYGDQYVANRIFVERPNGLRILFRCTVRKKWEKIKYQWLFI